MNSFNSGTIAYCINALKVHPLIDSVPDSATALYFLDAPHQGECCVDGRNTGFASAIKFIHNTEYTNLQTHLVSPFANFFSWVFPSSRPSLAATFRAKETLELPENILMLGIITPVNIEGRDFTIVYQPRCRHV